MAKKTVALKAPAKGKYIRTDFEKTLGSGNFPGDDWQAVSKLIPTLDKRFATK